MSGFDEFEQPDDGGKALHGLPEQRDRYSEEAPPLPGEEPPAAVPCNVEAEASLLGALMLENRLVDDVSFLRREMFYEPFHQFLYGLIRHRTGEGKIANPVTLAPYVGGDAKDEDVKATRHYLAALTGSGAAIIGARDFADQIRDLWQLRRVREICFETIARTETRDFDVAPDQIASDMEAEFADVLADVSGRTTTMAGDAAQEVVDEIERAAAGGELPGFLIARLQDWNRIVGRMEPEDFILLGARPSMGKTALAITVALGAAENGIGTDFLSLEMNKRKATRRALATMAHDPDHPIRYQDLIEGRLQRPDWRALADATSKMRDMPLTVSDPPGMAVEDLAPHIRKRQREFLKKFGKPLQLVVLDYLGRLTTRKKLQGETEIVSYISRMVKQAAKDCKVAIVCLTQLSRAVEQRENKRPMLADLRQSGSLEQDADTVVFIYREEYYLERSAPPRAQAEKFEKWQDELAAVHNDMEIYTAKAREGALRKRTVKFFAEYQAVLDSDDARLTNAPSFNFDNLGMPEQRG